MSTKKRHLYDMAWRVLLAMCRARGRAVTAGEFADEMGIARSTAQRWLADMLYEGAIYSFREIGKNGLAKSTFEPIGRNVTWCYVGMTEEEEREWWQDLDKYDPPAGF